MIRSARPATPADVAGHYDELDSVYRALWGRHLHHGLWREPGLSVEQAAEALSDAVGDRLGLRPGMALIDIGCGYGGTARRFAARGARVTGLTLSAAQIAAAPPAEGVTLIRRDWLANALPDAAFEGAYAIESTEHMADKAKAFAEARRVLKPGARLVVCAWLASPAASRWAVRHLLEPICREGRMPSLGTADDYRAIAKAAGFAVHAIEDVSAQVRRTWSICLRRFAAAFAKDSSTRRIALSGRHRAFALSLPRLILAYRTGAMRYGILTFVAR